VGFRQELLATFMQVAFVPRRGLLDSLYQTRGWLSMWRQDARLSLFPARCCSYQHVFVPRDDFIYAMCQVYLGEEELSSKKLARKCSHAMPCDLLMYIGFFRERLADLE
jgi:hypothetical protein